MVVIKQYRKRVLLGLASNQWGDRLVPPGWWGEAPEVPKALHGGPRLALERVKPGPICAPSRG